MRNCYTPEMYAFLREFIPGHMQNEIISEFQKRFDITLTKSILGNLKRKLGVKSGTHGGRFKPGQVPLNKGKTWDELGIDKATQDKMRQTSFKKGSIPANAKDKPVGYERVNVDGYTEVKVANSPSKHGGSDNFRLKHHLVWEEANGRPVPPMTVIVFADHDKTNFNPNNLVAVPREYWIVISARGIQYYNRESLEQALMIAKVERGIRKRRCDPRKCSSCGHVFTPRYPHQKTCDSCIKTGRREPVRIGGSND